MPTNAAANSATARPANKRRMRHARRRIAASLLLASERAFRWAALGRAEGRRADGWAVFIVSPVEWMAFQRVSTLDVGVHLSEPGRMLSARAWSRISSGTARERRCAR